MRELCIFPVSKSDPLKASSVTVHFSKHFRSAHLRFPWNAFVPASSLLIDSHCEMFPLFILIFIFLLKFILFAALLPFAKRKRKHFFHWLFLWLRWVVRVHSKMELRLGNRYPDPCRYCLWTNVTDEVTFMVFFWCFHPPNMSWETHPKNAKNRESCFY